MNSECNNMLIGTLSQSESLTGEINIYSEETTKDKYEGSYSVTPSTDQDVVLKTKDKLMTDDLTLKKIPFHETSNDSGGVTVYIGKEVEVNYG